MSKTQSKAKNGGKLVMDFPPEQRAAIHKKAGVNGVKAKQARRAAKDVLLDIFYSDSTDKDLSVLAQNKGIEPTELATLLLNMVRRAGKSAQMADIVFRLTGDLEQAPQQNITIVNGMSDEQLAAERAKILGSNSMIDITPKPPKIE